MENKYRVVFNCGHSKVMSDHQLANAPVEQLDTRTMQKTRAYLCDDCNSNRYGDACKLSPFQFVTHAQRLTPLDLKRLGGGG